MPRSSWDESTQGFTFEFFLPLTDRDRAWFDLRERLVRAAREMHFVAVSSEAMNGAVLLALAGNLAELAMSIPLSPTPQTSLVNVSTLLATQILQHGRQTNTATIAEQ